MASKRLSTIAPLIVVAAAVLWGSVGVFTKYLYANGFTPYQASMLRCFVAALVIVPYMFIRHRDQMKLRSWKDLGFFLISGTLGLALCYTAYFLTIQASTLSIAAVLLYSSPIMVTLLSAVLFKERLTPIKVISITLAFTGCIVMSGILGGAEVKLTLLGIVIGFLSGFGYTLYNIGSRFALAHYSTYAVTTYTFIFATIGMLFVTPVKQTAVMVFSSPLTVVITIALGILPTLIPYTIYVLALNYVEVSKASIIAIIEPVAATLIGAVFFSEHITLNVVIAMLLIFASVVLSNIKFGGKVKKDGVAIDITLNEEADTFLIEEALSEKLAEDYDFEKDFEKLEERIEETFKK